MTPKQMSLSMQHDAGFERHSYRIAFTLHRGELLWPWWLTRMAGGHDGY